MDPDGEFAIDGFGLGVGPWTWDSEKISNGSLGFSQRAVPPKPQRDDYGSLGEYLKADIQYLQDNKMMIEVGVGSISKKAAGWLSPTKWANAKANDILKGIKKSGVGSGARSGQHGRPYSQAAKELNALAKDKGLLSGVRKQLSKKASEFESKAKTINHK